MALVSLNVAPEYNTEPGEMNCCPMLYLSAEQCEALGIKGAIDAGTVIGMTIRCLVKSATTSIDDPDEGEGEGDNAMDVSLCLQITDAEITAAPSASTSSAAKTLYGNGD